MGAYMDASLSGVLVSWKDIIDVNITCIYTHKSSLAIATCEVDFEGWGGATPKGSREIEKPSHAILFKEPK